MKELRWNEEKNSLLKNTRGIGFEDVAIAIDEGRVLAVIDHPNQEKHPKQKIVIVAINNYAYLVPYVITKEDNAFLKTVIPSRDATKKYITNNKQ